MILKQQIDVFSITKSNELKILTRTEFYFKFIKYFQALTVFFLSRISNLKETKGLKILQRNMLKSKKNYIQCIIFFATIAWCPENSS